METNLPPGPRNPMLAQTIAFVRDPVRFLERLRSRFGPVFRVKLLGYPRFVYVAEPKHFEQGAPAFEQFVSGFHTQG